MISLRVLRPAALAVILLGAAQINAAAALDLQRVTPVPATEPIPVMDFFRTPLMASPVLNPSGTLLTATIAADEDNTSIMVYNLQTKKVETMNTELERDIFDPRWLGDSRLLYQMAVRKIGSGGLYVTNAGAFSSGYPLLQFVGARIVAIPVKDRTHPLAQLWPNSMNTDKFGAVATLDTDSRTGSIMDLTRWASGAQTEEARQGNEQHIMKRFPVLATPTRFAENYEADREGRLAFGTTSSNGVLNLHAFADGKWQACPQDLDEIGFLGAGNNPGEIVIVAARQDGKPRPLQTVDALSGKVIQEMIRDTAYDFSGYLYRDAATNSVVGGMFNRARPEPVWFDEGYRSLQKAVDALFPGTIVRILGTDVGGKVLLVSTSSDRQPETFSWVNLEQKAAGLIQHSRPWLDTKRMQPMGMIKYKTRDGRKLDAYLTLPAGATKQNPPPLVVLPHPDVNGRDVWGFNATVQFLASRGYAVLQPNYRGSAGYGWMFTSADEWDYAKMRDDVTDATKTLAASGLVDRNRIAIMGDAFAGYLAVAAVAFEPELYRCAIALSPVCDWGREIEGQKFRQHENGTYSRLIRKLGDPKSEKFDGLSPLRHAASVKAPVLIAYGEYFDAERISVIKDFVSAVKRNSTPAEAVWFSNEGAELRRLTHKVEFYGRVEAFLAEHLRATAPAGK
jgi:dienelactone hydrolase